MNLVFSFLEDWRTYFLNRVVSTTVTIIVDELKKCITVVSMFVFFLKNFYFFPHFNCKTPKNWSNKSLISGIKVSHSFYCRRHFLFNHQNEWLILHFKLKWRDMTMLSDLLKFQCRLLMILSLNCEADASYSLFLAFFFWVPCQTPQ